MIGLAIVLTAFTVAYLLRDYLRARNAREIHHQQQHRMHQFASRRWGHGGRL